MHRIQPEDLCPSIQTTQFLLLFFSFFLTTVKNDTTLHSIHKGINLGRGWGQEKSNELTLKIAYITYAYIKCFP